MKYIHGIGAWEWENGMGLLTLHYGGHSYVFPMDNSAERKMMAICIDVLINRGKRGAALQTEEELKSNEPV